MTALSESLFVRWSGAVSLELDCKGTKADAGTDADADADTGAGILLTTRRSTDQRPHSFIFIHTHKVGGSTVRGVRDHIARKFGL